MKNLLTLTTNVTKSIMNNERLSNEDHKVVLTIQSFEFHHDNVQGKHF